MNFYILIFSCLFACYFAAPLNHIATPFGYVHEKCHHDVESGSHLERSKNGGIDVFRNGKFVRNLPVCSAKSTFYNNEKFNNMRKFNANKTNQNVGAYDGWLGYTTFENKAGVDKFLGSFTVPDKPQSMPERLFIFTGLQNVDWIPIVDKEPPVFDIIQPVLQYPATNTIFDEWSARSWYVTLDVGTIASDQIEFKTGDVVFGNMTKTGSDKWFINSVNRRTGKETYVSVRHQRLSIQPWAYTTIECYGCDGGCSYLPTLPCKFSQMSLSLQNKPITPVWKTHQTPNPKCATTAHVHSPSAVSYTFQN